MNIKKTAIFLRRLLFVALVIGIILHMTPIFERKTLNDQWNYTLKVGGFANEPENSVSVVGVGSSHMYCTLNPVHIYEQRGITSYVLATQQQPVEATYYYVKEALETQSPKVVIIEAFMYMRDTVTASEGVAHDATDPFPDNFNKLCMIHDMNAVGEKANYYFNFMKYHTRWKELEKIDFEREYENETDPFHGYVFLTSATENNMKSQDYTKTAPIPLEDNALEYLEKTVDLILDHGAEPLILISPYDAEAEGGRCRSIHDFAAKKGVALLDLNLEYDSLGIDNSTDYYDATHLNVYGASKASLYIADYISESFNITGDTSFDELWQEDIRYYKSQLDKAE